MLRVEFKSGHALPWQVKALQNTIVAQVPNLNRAIRGPRGDPLAIGTLTNGIDRLGVLAQRGHTLLLPLIPDSNLRILTTREQIRITH